MKSHNFKGLSQATGKTIARKIAFLLTPILMYGLLAKLTRLLETYLAFIQGKGAGYGWDIQGEVATAIKFIPENAIVLDVGANKGEWTLQILKALGNTKCHIFQFEPSPHCQKILRSLHLPQTTLIEAAVGAEPGMAVLYSPFPGSPISSLHPRRDSYFNHNNFQEEKVQVVTIDQIVNQFKIDKVDLIKLDVEGHELDVLRGAYNSLKNKRIKALTFEFGSGNINSRTFFHDFYDILHSQGYKIYRICPNSVLLPIEKYYEDLEYFRGVSNYLAVI